MSSRDEAFYRRAMRRIEQIMVFLAVAGVILCWGMLGWRAATGYAAGTLIAILSFWILRRLALGINAAQDGKPPRSASAVALGLRYAFIGLALFGIIKLPGVEPVLVFAGLMTTVAAVLAEIAYELIFLRDLES